MLKETDKYDNTAHFSYSDYKRKVKKGPNKDMTVFVSVFIIGLLIILGFAKILSPNVDVGISDDTEVSATTDDDTMEDNSASVIDDRLKKLQDEDSGKKVNDEDMFSPELDEKVVLPNHKKKTVGQMEAEMADMLKAQKNEQKTTEHQPTKNTQVQQHAQPVVNHQSAPVTHPQSAPTPAQIVNAKVVVGYYATEKQAEVAKSIIQDAGLGVSPVVKNLGGYYTLQVGSYTSREKAQQAANNLLKSNFPARVIVE